MACSLSSKLLYLDNSCWSGMFFETLYN